MANLEEKLIIAPNKIVIPDNDGKMQIGGGPISSQGQSIPTCTVCEKVLIAEMREKYNLFNKFYGLGHALLKAWMWFSLPKTERCAEEDNAVRKCRTCEKVGYRLLRAKSTSFDKFYKFMDASLEGWIEKYLNDEDRERAFARDPAHARALMQFNPRNYYLGEAFILGIKFDGVVAQEVEDGFPDKIGEPRDNIKEMLTAFKSQGAKIIMYGWRSNAKGNPQYRKQAEKWLKYHQIPYNFFYDGKGPLIADIFVSPRNVGGDLSRAYPDILQMAQDPSKGYLKRRHIL